MRIFTASVGLLLLTSQPVLGCGSTADWQLDLGVRDIAYYAVAGVLAVAGILLARRPSPRPPTTGISTDAFANGGEK